MSQFNDARPQAWIPHRGAMQLIDRVVEVGAEHSVAEVDVPADGLFVRDGKVPGWVGIEYMAQTVSAWAGGRARNSGKPPRVGLLLGTRRYEARRAAFPSGALLRVEARCELMADNGLGMFDCRILMDGEEVASAKISVLDPPDGAALLRGGAAQ
jgi:predicted hotdog family 3-hydroxylacyl-ACP dehydratase